MNRTNLLGCFFFAVVEVSVSAIPPALSCDAQLASKTNATTNNKIVRCFRIIFSLVQATPHTKSVSQIQV
jgi:hypothetical protein